MIRLLAVDMDGTCLNDHKKISEGTMEALRKAAAAGILVVPTTGRTITCLPHQLKNAQFYRYVISSNGAAVTDIQTGQDLFSARIPCADAISLLWQGRKQGLGVSVHAGHLFVIEGHCLRLIGRLGYGKDASSTVYSRNISDELEQHPQDVEEVQFFYFTSKARKRAENLLRGHPELLQAYAERYVELYSRQASKGAALKALAQMLDISQSQIACVGDGENDLSMFCVAGCRFAMGNGIPELRQAADHILPDNNSDGVAEAVRQILLHQ